MGFYKNVDKKDLEKDRYCKYCGGCNLDFLKIISYGKRGKEYSYKILCRQCQKSYFTKRTAYIYEKVKDRPWYKTESLRKMETMKNKQFK